jgi:drug/metabolite transporter (DMT)-like permease
MNQHKGLLAILISAAGYGTAAIFAKLAFAQGLDTFNVLTVRYSLAALVMWSYLLATGQHQPVQKKDRIWILLAALFGNILIPILYFQGLQRLPISLFAILSYIYPAFVILISWAFLREKLGGHQWTALLLTLGGCGVMYWSREIRYDLVGVALALGASFSYSLYILGIARGLKAFSPARAMTYTITIAAGAFIITGLISGRLIMPSPTGWGILGLMAIFSTAAASIAFFTGIRLIGPSRAALISTIEPVFTIILAMLIFQEPIAGQQALGAGMVILALLILHAGTPRIGPLPRKER